MIRTLSADVIEASRCSALLLAGSHSVGERDRLLCSRRRLAHVGSGARSPRLPALQLSMTLPALPAFHGLLSEMQLTYSQNMGSVLDGEKRKLTSHSVESTMRHVTLFPRGIPRSQA